jgi:hypothetical protein
MSTDIALMYAVRQHLNKSFKTTEELFHVVNFIRSTGFFRDFSISKKQDQLDLCRILRYQQVGLFENCQTMSDRYCFLVEGKIVLTEPKLSKYNTRDIYRDEE